MVYELPPIIGTPESTTTDKPFLEGIVSQTFKSTLDNMEFLSRRASLYRQNGLNSDGKPFEQRKDAQQAKVLEYAREPELISA
jgi:hypothetical protein